MIKISAIGTRSYSISLPHYLTFGYSNPRQQTTRVALGGNEVQQYAAKSVNAGSITYQGTINTADATEINELQYDVGECKVSDGSNAWQATISAELSPSKTLGKTMISIIFKVIRKIA